MRDRKHEREKTPQIFSGKEKHLVTFLINLACVCVVFVRREFQDAIY